MKESREQLFRKDAELGLRLFQGVAEAAARLLFQQHAHRRQFGQIAPVPAPFHDFHRVAVNRFELLPAAVQGRQQVLQGQIEAAAGGVGRFGRFPMRVLEGLLGRRLIGRESGRRLGLDRLVLFLQGVVLGLKLGRR